MLSHRFRQVPISKYESGSAVPQCAAALDHGHMVLKPKSVTMVVSGCATNPALTGFNSV